MSSEIEAFNLLQHTDSSCSAKIDLDLDSSVDEEEEDVIYKE